MSIVEGNRGLKRKREGKEEDVSQKIQTKLHHAVKEVKKASKRVKVFETQKIVKKIKEARKGNNEEVVKTQESQLDCIKHIDCERIGVQALRSKIQKDRGLWTNSDCQSAVTAELPDPSTQNDETDLHPQHAIVKARLLSSKVLAQEIDDIVQALRAVLGIQRKENIQVPLEASDVQEVTSPTNGSTEVSKVERKEKSTKDISHVEGSDVTDSEEGSDAAEAAEGWTGFGDASGDKGDRDVESEAEEGVEYDEGSAAEAAEWESGTVDDVDDDDDDDLSDEDVNSDTDEGAASALSDDPGPSKKARPATTPKSNGKAGESTFLPSLSVGFVKGSDSEWSDAEADLADLPQKKNRRGQRARKAIWEKKFGKNANHLKKQRESEVQDVIARSYAKRGRGSGRGGAGGGRGRGGLPPQNSSYSTGRTEDSAIGGGRGGRHPLAGSRQSQAAQAAHRDSQLSRAGGEAGERSSTFSRPAQQREERPLHPSWEAKRRLKEKQSPAILPAQGTRIKFD